MQTLLPHVNASAITLRNHIATTVSATLAAVRTPANGAATDGYETRALLLSTAASFSEMAQTSQSCARALMGQVRNITESLPLIEQLPVPKNFRAAKVKRTGNRLDILLATMGTTLEAELKRRGAESVRKALEDHLKSLGAGFEKIPYAVPEVGFARLLAQEKGLAFSRETVGRTVAEALKSADAPGAYALTFLRRSERVVAMHPVGSRIKRRLRDGEAKPHGERTFGRASIGFHGPKGQSPFRRGPALELVYVSRDGSVTKDTLAQANFEAGVTLVLNAASLG